jgi:hypothetical protein
MTAGFEGDGKGGLFTLQIRDEPKIKTMKLLTSIQNIKDMILIRENVNGPLGIVNEKCRLF